MIGCDTPHIVVVLARFVAKAVFAFDHEGDIAVEPCVFFEFCEPLVIFGRICALRAILLLQVNKQLISRIAAEAPEFGAYEVCIPIGKECGESIGLIALVKRVLPFIEGIQEQAVLSIIETCLPVAALRGVSRCREVPYQPICLYVVF